MTKLTELERLEKAVEDAFNTYDAARSNVYSIAKRTAYVAYAKARDELEDYRNYKKAQLIQQLAEIVIRHDIETT